MRIATKDFYGVSNFARLQIRQILRKLVCEIYLTLRGYAGRIQTIVADCISADDAETARYTLTEFKTEKLKFKP